MIDKATEACRQYDFWASEVKRLTDAIVANECPRVLEWRESFNDPDAPWWAHGGPDEPVSHFREAADESLPRCAPDDGPVRRTLVQIRETVKDCPKCRDLCDLIGARRHARKQFGVAKRRVRQIGRAAVPV